jgi:hypothetical protein
MLPTEMIFTYGFLGAFAVEFHAMYQEINQRIGLPARYTRIGYWALQIVHAGLGGCLAIAWTETYPNTNPLTVMAVGGSARLIILKFGEIVSRGKKPE